MLKVLVWIEPHPIRESFTAFAAHGQFLSDIVPNDGREISSRIFSNRQTLDLLAKRRGADASRLVYPTEKEQRELETFHGPWNSGRINDWLNLVRGAGEVAAFYRSILDRLMSDHQFDTFICWSDNGALRACARDNDVRTLHCELGPTRGRFGETFYIDPVGTNGFAAVRQVPDKVLDGLAPKPINEIRAILSRFTPGALLEGQSPARDVGLSQGKPRALVPLQLADDLNALLHSPYNSPAAFVNQTVPALLEQGYEVVVKGHPAATADRAGDVALKQDEAITAASKFGSDVHIMNSEADWPQYLKALNEAILVCSINSSVAFEALLLEKQVQLAGEAAFDFNGRLSSASGTPKLQKLLAFMSGKYLHPMQMDTARSVTKRLLMMPPFKGLQHAEFWDEWLSQRNHFSPVNETRSFHFIARNALMRLARPKGRLIGHVDRILTDRLASGQLQLTIEGWIDTTAHGDRICNISVLDRQETLATETQFFPRYDVVNSLHRKNSLLGFRFDLGELKDIPDEVSFSVVTLHGRRYRSSRVPVEENKNTVITTLS